MKTEIIRNKYISNLTSCLFTKNMKMLAILFPINFWLNFIFKENYKGWKGDRGGGRQGCFSYIINKFFSK